MPRSRSDRHRCFGDVFDLAFLASLACALPILCGGCLAMNIPSVRYDDPQDRGGLFGPHKPQDPDKIAQLQSQSEIWHDPSASVCNDCGDENALMEETQSEKPPEIPWPRYHPLPTRPVFSLPQ